MYITVKNVEQINKINEQPKISNAIDAIFNGVFDIKIPAPIEDKLIIRTRTHKIDKSQCVVTEATVDALRRISITLDTLKLYVHPAVEQEYETFKIPKKTHGYREINAPSPRLKKDMADIANQLTYRLKLLAHDSAWAYVKGRDVVHAMQEHTANESRWFLKIDLHDFFGSCNKEFIVNQLNQIYPFAVIESKVPKQLADFATLHDGLPQGTPLSPVLTNLIMIPIDYEINRLLFELSTNEKIYKQKYIYTRYADDIIISGKYKFDYKKVIAGINRILKDTPLEINKEKTRFGSNAGRNWNLGVMCNKNNQTTIGYKQKHKLKVAIHSYANEEQGWTRQDIHWLQGQLSWLQQVEPDYYVGFNKYLTDKYGFDIPNKIISDLKSNLL